MLNQATMDMLTAMKMTAMPAEFANQLKDPTFNELGFEERLGLLVNAEWPIGTPYYAMYVLCGCHSWLPCFNNLAINFVCYCAYVLEGLYQWASCKKLSFMFD